MEIEKTKNEVEKRENDIIYSKAIKAGKRIYYLDVKKSRNDDLFVAITESKKRVSGADENMQVTYEKHKIFLYKEDFDKFIDGLEDVIGYIKRGNAGVSQEDDDFSVEDEFEEEESPVEEKTSRGFFDKFKKQ
ncbi:DUF3276 family protein [Paludibacter sp. 221]|uniref:DUF3276 family protein n=1 Tax=Paludibacter sp. 221 TaxID=2302939 RepID=UPI0013D7B3C0|nr:DUF3276 family protein [Paludibacter sp. 221]NDV47588.1 DUF3276 family protein [Paludibacter sp. 221]